MEGQMMKHFSHEHPLFLKREEPKINDDSDTEITSCNGCLTPLAGPFYSCGDCAYFLHKKCAELPMEMKHPMHPEHILTLLVRSPYPSGGFSCDLCNENWSQVFVYNCSTCSFDLDIICASGSHIMFGSHTMKHFSHKHPLFLKREERKINDDSDTEITSCNGCSTPLTGPFYGCGECPYNLHKTCAELPMKMNHPMHPEHPLTLHLKPPYSGGGFACYLCREIWSQTFVYSCYPCDFDVDMMCASASHTIADKCHPHPLTPSQDSTVPFPCHICRTREKGVSYKCNTCLFWVHQNCTTLVEDTVVHGDHEHPLTLLPSIPLKYNRYSRFCDICYDPLFSFGCSYYCEGCWFFAHVNCATSKSNQDVQLDEFSLPIQQESTNLISQFVENYIDSDADVDDESDHLCHRCHSLLLVGEQDANEKICDSCCLPISTPSYDCSECGYYLHKWCAELPKSIQHPSHPAHKLSLQGPSFLFYCKCCFQCCNGFGYKCLQCEEDEFKIDIKCASLLGIGPPIYHEAHKHPFVPKFSLSTICSACRDFVKTMCTLQCETCSFNLCFVCAMMPAIVNHRYDTHPFVLTYSPPGSDYDHYICDLCENWLNPKHWHYNCRLCDRFIHTWCMRFTGAGFSIKYGKKYQIDGHEHDATLISCTYNYSPCSDCHNTLLFGDSGLGYECVTCNYRTHNICPK